MSVSAEVSKNTTVIQTRYQQAQSAPNEKPASQKGSPPYIYDTRTTTLLAAATARARARACVCSLRVELPHYMERVTATEPTAAYRGAGVAATCDARPALRFYQQDWQCSASVVAPWPGYSPF